MTKEYLLINNEQEKRIIHYNAILYVITEDYLSTFILINQDKFTCSRSLCKIKDLLPSNFIQINRGCIVNLNEVVSIKRNLLLILTDKSEHRISFRRAKKFMHALTHQDLTPTR